MNKVIGSGRKKGSLNKVSKDTRTIIKDIVNNELKGISGRLESLTDTERVYILIKLLPFCIPTYNKIMPEIPEEDKIKGITVNIEGVTKTY